MKLSGTILNAKDYKPVEGAKITLKIQDKEIAKPATYSDGRYEYRTDEDYIGQTLTYVIEKDDFEKKTFSTIIDKPEIQKKFLFRAHETKDKWAKLKGFGYGISIFMVILALLVIFNPPVEIEQTDSIPNELEQNHRYTVDIQVTRVGFWNRASISNITTVNWTLSAEHDEWVRFSRNGKTSKKLSYTGKNSTETVQVTIFTPDFVLSPGEGTTKIYLDNKNLDILNFLKSVNFTLDDSAVIRFRLKDTKKRPKLAVELDTRIINGTLDTKDLEKAYEIRIENIGTGTPWWSLRDDKAWIELKDYDSDERRFEDGSVYFTINKSELNIRLNESKGKPVEGNITLGYNNDGKDKIHIFVYNNSDNATIRIFSIIESWYLPDYYGKNVTSIRAKLPEDF